MFNFSTIPVSISFKTFVVTTSLPAVTSSVCSTDITACLFSAPICALEFTVGPSDLPSGRRVLKPQEDNNSTSNNHLIYFPLLCCFLNAALACLNKLAIAVLPITLARCSATVNICIFLA